MRMEKGIRSIRALPLLLLGLFLVFGPGCATVERLYSKLPFVNSNKNEDRSTVGDFAPLLPKVMPYHGDIDSLYKQACYFQQIGKHRLAIEDFRTILSVDPGHVQAYNGMGVSYDLSGDLPRAIESYKRALDLDPKLDYVKNNLGLAYLRMGKTDSAVEAFQEAIALNSQKGRYHNNLGLAYAKKGKLHLAFEEFTLAGGKARAHYNLAQVLYRSGSYREAKAHFTMALHLNASIVGAKTGLKATEFRLIESQEKAGESPDSKGITEKSHEQTEGTTKQNYHDEPVIEVSNGNGVYQMARRVKSHLKENGVTKVRLSNARHFNYGQSKIYYCEGYFENAEHLAELIPGRQDLVKVEGFQRPDVKIKILIGKDVIPYDPIFAKAHRKSML
jgi:tetratricopeptide (TPR) repeat protein